MGVTPPKCEPAALARSFRILYGIQKTLKRVSVRIVKDWYTCFHGWYGYFNFAEVRWLGGKMVWKTHITHVCRARNDGKNRPREFWRTRTAWSTSFFIRCSCNDLFFSANNPLISSLTLFIHLSSDASNFIFIKLYYNFHIYSLLKMIL